MEVKNWIMGIVSLLVGVILVVSVLMPAVSDADNATVDVTYENEDKWFSATQITADDSEVKVIEFSTPSGSESEWCLTYDGETISIGANVSVLSLDGKNVLRSLYRGGLSHAGFLLTNVNEGVYVAVSGQITQGTITLESGTATITYTTLSSSTETTASYTYTTAMIPALNGEYIMSTGDGEYFALPTSTIYGVGLTSANSVEVMIEIEGTIESPQVSVIATTSGTAATIENVVSNYAAFGENGVMWDSITFDIVVGGESTSATYDRMWVPAEVIIKEPIDSTVTSIISIIPLLFVVGLILGAIGMFVSRRD